MTKYHKVENLKEKFILIVLTRSPKLIGPGLLSDYG